MSRRTASRSEDGSMRRRVCTALALVGLLLGVPGSLSAEPASVFEFEAKRLGGPVESLGRYRGQVLLIVNTASRCGYTPQYEGLQALYSRYQARGFSVLGFPSNDFARQEPGNDEQIRAFCRANYGVEFPMFSKVKVGEPDAHPLFAYLTSRPAPIGGPVEWNFQKYLVDRNGAVVARYRSRIPPEAPELVAEIERLLGSPDAIRDGE